MRNKRKFDIKIGDHLEEKLRDRADILGYIISTQMTSRAQKGERFPSSFQMKMFL